LKKRPFNALKIAALAPMPNASDRIATAVKPGDLIKPRSA